jgi:hypothetical protein
LGTVIWVTLFDGSTLEITERSHVRFERLRESRFSDAALQTRVELVRGSIFGAMAPVVEREYGELEVVTAAGTVTVKDERKRQSASSTAFVVEVRDSNIGSELPVRAAAFHGQLSVTANAGETQLVGPEQIELDVSGTVVRSDTIRSEVLANGSFEARLDGWNPTYSADAREPQDRVGIAEAVAIDDGTGDAALHLYRQDSSIWARTGVSQTIDRTLRLPAALTLTFDVLIEHQGPPVSGRATVPLTIELQFTDVLGQDREWKTVYTVEQQEGVVEADASTTVIAGDWTKVIVDLENLEPIPKILGTLVVYASGGGYETYVANLSLTTGEGTAAP